MSLLDTCTVKRLSNRKLVRMEHSHLDLQTRYHRCCLSDNIIGYIVSSFLLSLTKRIRELQLPVFRGRSVQRRARTDIYREDVIQKDTC